VIVTVFPPIVTVALRVVVTVLAAAAIRTVPFPVPVWPEVTVSQLALGVAVHGQLLVETVTLTFVVPPSAATLAVVGVSVYVQPLPV
jgi:hypothetical protein